MRKGNQVPKVKMTKKDTRTFWRAVIITGVLSSLPLLLAFMIVCPRSSRNMPISYSSETAPIESATTNGATTTTSTETTVTVPSSAFFSEEASKAANPETYRKEAKKYYSTFQEAINAYHSGPDIDVHRVSGKIFQYENRNAVIAYYWCINRNNVLGLSSIFSVKKDGKYSDILEYGTMWAGANPMQKFYFYTFSPDETVASYLPDQCFNEDVRSLPTGGSPVYFGISSSPAVRNLRILGEPPTRIIKSSIKGKTYYVWIYEGLDIRGALLKTNSFSFGNFTYGQMIDILHIHFVPSTDPLSKNVPIVTAN